MPRMMRPLQRKQLAAKVFGRYSIYGVVRRVTSLKRESLTVSFAVTRSGSCYRVEMNVVLSGWDLAW
jgi:hypothetical protein